MAILNLFFSILIFCSCAKISYLMEQGSGQMKLTHDARANQEVLDDPAISVENKEKIKAIALYKKFFYEYFARPETEIYSKTTILGRPAVSYLVIASPVDDVSAREECFPFMGCFPYLGFFNEESAKKYQASLEAENWVTWKRPVYAYSTLGYLTDNILSSFFHYKEEELAELVFHELFHTIFFIKDEIDLNENLANYFGHQMVFEYFKYDQKQKEKIFKKEKDHKELNQLIVNLVKELKTMYMMISNKDEKNKTSMAQDILKSFLSNRFDPEVKKFCGTRNFKDKECVPLGKEWNNARFAAFMTYEKEHHDIEKIHQTQNNNLKQFFEYLQTQYEQYKDSRELKEKSFTEFLFQKV